MHGRPQRALIIQALTWSSVTTDEVVDCYRAFGGTAPRDAVREYLRGAADLPFQQSDILADVVNDLLGPTSGAVPVPPVAEDAPEESAETSRHNLGAGGAFLLSDAEKEEERLAAVARTTLLDTVPEERFDRITREARDRFQVSSAIVTLIDDRRQFLKSVIGPVEQNMPRTRSFCNTTILASGPLIVRDTFDDEHFRWSPLVLGEPFIRFYAGYPLRGPGGWTVGTLCVIDQDPRDFSRFDGRSLRRLARVAEHELAA